MILEPAASRLVLIWTVPCALVILFFLGVPKRAESASPQIEYMLHCQGCHLEDGSGTGDKVPQLKGFVGNFLAVPGGKEYLVRVPGSASSIVDDAGLARILNWMLLTFSENEIPADFEFYTEGYVAERRVPLVEVEKTRSNLLEQMSRLDSALPSRAED